MGFAIAERVLVGAKKFENLLLQRHDWSRNMGKYRAMSRATDVREQEENATLRGELFSGLDRLAFALEMEAAELVERGLHSAAERRTSERLGVRLAQRLVAGVWADEVHLRMRRWEAAYEARLGGND